MATYTAITQTEVEDFLGADFRQVQLDGTRELVYGKRIDVPADRNTPALALSLRVYTGIEPDGMSREAGKDAMRCNIFWRRPDGELAKVASSKRVHRVAGWRANLQSRLDELHIEKRCPDCGSPMCLRKVKNGPRKGSEFYGCASYPECRKTVSAS